MDLNGRAKKTILGGISLLFVGICWLQYYNSTEEIKFDLVSVLPDFQQGIRK